MVSLRCKMMVTQKLKKLGLQHRLVELAMVELMEDIKPLQQEQLKKNLLKSGLELLEDKESILIEKIKMPSSNSSIIQMSCRLLLTQIILPKAFKYDYTYLANIFSEVQSITIQQFIIINKIERVKELLLYNELNLTEIAFKLHYSSVAHLSNQFKKITGLSPSFYKQFKRKRQINLETV